MNILMVMTSHGKLGDTGRKSRVCLEEFATSGASMTIQISGVPAMDW